MSSSPQLADASSQQQRQLPTPRQLLTAILDAISEIPPGPSPVPHSHPTAATGLNGAIITATIAAANKSSSTTTTTNPLAHIPPSARHLFTTLHVLFPSLLLPALDLLDRGLVTRLAVAVDGDGVVQGKQQQPHNHHAPQDQQPRQDKDEEEEQQRPQLEQAIPHIYVVRSAQKISSNPYHHHHNNNDSSPGLGPGPGQTYSNSHNINNNQRLYAVHTLVWNCTCAAFAFSAFPVVSSAGDSGNIAVTPTKKQKEQEQQQHLGAQSPETSPSRRRQHHSNDIGTEKQTTNIPGYADRRDDHDHDDDVDEEEINLPDSRDFGGLSFNGTEQDGNDGRRHTSSTGNASVPPCCKHLLACVLAERWDAVLGRYVNRRTVQREELAGIFADV